MYVENESVQREIVLNYHNQIIIKNKLTLVSQVIESFINTTEVLNGNSAILDKRLEIFESALKQLASQDNDWMYNTHIITMFNIFASNFRTIFIKLGEIETALAFSRISILTPKYY